MKSYFLLLLGILLMVAPVFGQKTVVVVEPDPGIDIGALNEAIEAAETAGTASNTIFELRRDGIYYLNGSIAHSGYTLHIRTEEGSGSKAVLQPSVDETGDSDKHFKVSGDLILKDIYVLGRDELGGYVTQPIDVVGGNCTVILDNCVMDYSSQSIVATHSADNRVYVKNTVIRNCLRPPNPSNGRVIDTRGNGNDTLWISNCTIYNNGATQLRSDGGACTFAKFDHNTVYQTSFAHEMRLDFIKEAHVTNNLFYNYVYRARSQPHRQLFSCDSIFATVVDVYGYDDVDRYFDLSNNNYWVDDTIGAIMEEYGPDGLYYFYDWDPARQDTIWYKHGPIDNWFASDEILALNEPEATPDMVVFIENGQVDTTGLFREKVTFKNPPALNLDYWKYYVENEFSISGLDNIPIAFADENPLVLGEVQEGAYDFSYNANSRSATAADDGLPLGSSRWTPYWGVSVEEIKAHVGVRTFPNPFDKEVKFEYDDIDASTVKVRIFDLMGREIFSETRTAKQGNGGFTLDLGDLSRSGIFLYQVEFASGKGLKSISTGKIIKK